MKFGSVLLALFLGIGLFENGLAVESTFDTDLDGWTTNDIGLFQHNISGGNPGGFLFLDNDEGGDLAFLETPSKFLGDLSGFDGGTIAFDGNQLGDGGTFFESVGDYGTITIAGTAGSASLDLLPGGATPPLQSWQSYDAPLDAATWGVSQIDWEAILADVTSIRLGVEGLFGAEVNGIDNFRITAIPEPSSILLMAFASVSIAGLRRRN